MEHPASKVRPVLASIRGMLRRLLDQRIYIANINNIKKVILGAIEKVVS